MKYCQDVSSVCVKEDGDDKHIVRDGRGRVGGYYNLSDYYSSEVPIALVREI